MVEKHKVKKEKKLEVNDNAKWGIVLVAIGIFIVFNIFGTRSLVVKMWHKLIPTPTPTPTKVINITPSVELNTDQANYVKLAIEALAAKLKVKKENIEVVTVTKKEWGDSSLGCPEKNKLYLQVITQGYEIVLQYKGKKYIYNGGLNRIISCQK